MKVGTRLLLAFSIIVVLLWLVVFFAMNGLRTISGEFSTLEAEALPGLLTLNDIETAADQAYQEALYFVMFNKAEARQTAEAHLEKLTDIENAILLTGEPESLPYADTHILSEKISGFRLSVFDFLFLKNDPLVPVEIVEREHTRVLENLRAVQQETLTVKAVYIDRIGAAANDFNKSYDTSVVTLLVSTGALSLAAIAAAVVTSRSILFPLRRLYHGAEKIASGDFEVRVGTTDKDEIGQLARAFDHMTRNLSTTMTSVARLNEEIAAKETMQQALEQSEEQLKSYMEYAPEGIYISSLDGTFIYGNRKAEEITGYKREYLIGKNFFEAGLLPPEAEEKAKILLAANMAGEATGPDEFELVRQDGATIRVEITTNPVMQEKTPVVLGFVRDFSEHRKAEAALAAERARAQHYFDIAGTMLIALDNNGVVTMINKKGAELLVDNTENIIGRNWVENFIPEPDKERNRAVFEKLVHGQIVRREMRTEGRIINSLGEIRLISWYNTLVRDEDGIIKGTLSSGEDITERKKIEEELRESEKKFSAAFQASPDAISISRLSDGVFLEINDSYTDLTGFSREEVVGKTANDLEIWLDDNQQKRFLSLIQHGDKLRNQEWQFRCKNGETKTWLVSCDYLAIHGEACLLMVSNDISRRKKVMQALEESEMKFSMAFQNSPNLYTMIDFDTMSYAEVNNSFLVATGYNRDEVIGSAISELQLFINNEDMIRFDGLIKAGGSFANEEFEFRMKSGEIRTWLCSAETLIFSGKQHLLAVAVDVTERKKAEESARISDAAFKSLHDCVIVMDTDFIVQQWNAVAEELFGIPAEKAIGNSIGEYLQMVEDFPGQNEERVRLLVQQGFNREEQRYITPRGEIWLDVHTQAIEENGKRYGYVTLSMDISARKAAETMLKESEERYRDLFENASDFIQSVKPDGTFLYVNRAWRQALDYSEEDINHITLWDVIAPELIDKCRSIFSTALSGKPLENVETVFVGKSGNHINVEGNVNTIFKNDEIIATRAIFHDITARKQVEEELRQLDRMKQEFLSNVSHELRTPLQSIGGFTKLILNGDVPDPETQQEFLQIIDSETAHLGNLINSLLDMSRLEAGRFQIQKTLRNPGEIISDSVKIFLSLAKEKNIKIDVQVQPGLPEIMVDGDRLRQVALNLVNNALKFSDPGTTVTVSAKQSDNQIVFQVRDQGIGISKEDIKNLFSRFYRAKDEKARGGTGLGLFIARQIIEAHDGSIEVESKLGKGSTFTVRLPIQSKGD